MNEVIREIKGDFCFSASVCGDVVLRDGCAKGRRLAKRKNISAPAKFTEPSNNRHILKPVVMLSGPVDLVQLHEYHM